MAIREGAWDCPHCGRKGNRGPEKYCGGCGAPRGPEVKLYLPEDAAEVTDPEALKRARSAPDWICEYCGADNRAENGFCSGCGAPRDGAKTRQVVEHRLDAQPVVPPPPPARKGPGSRIVKIGCLALIGLAVLVWLLGRPREAVLTVTGHEWMRSIEVEAFRPVTEEAWEGELPSGARPLASERKVHHVNRIQIGTETRTRSVSEQVQTGTERVKVGVRDLGNGYFEDIYEDRPVYETRTREETYEEPVYREDPVYRNRIRYEVDKWIRDREPRAEGRDLAPRWPDPGVGGRERESKRSELYKVDLEDEDGDGYTWETRNEVEWRSYREGESYKGKVRGSKIVELESPERGS